MERLFESSTEYFTIGIFAVTLPKVMERSGPSFRQSEVEE
jgi:hypothetical protein